MNSFMSMHEFEDLTELSINRLQESNRIDLDYRSIFYTLYDFQSWWDTGSTEFKVINTLVKRKYAYAFEVSEHPDYFTYKDFFDELSGCISLYRTPTLQWNKKDNPEIGVFCNPKEAWGEEFAERLGVLNKPLLYCFVNSELWQKFVDSGKLQGEDSVPAKILDLKNKSYVR